MLIKNKLMKKYFVSNTTPETLLNEDGQPYSCPFAPPLIVHHPISGQPQAIQKACSEECLFYDSHINDINDNNMMALHFTKTVTLDCCNTVINAKIDNNIQP